MQIDGYPKNHGQESHKVTNCLMDHTETVKKGGAAGASPDNLPVTVQKTDEQLMAEGKLSLSAWVQKTFDKGKRMLASFWGEGAQNTQGHSTPVKDVSQNVNQVMAQLAEQRDSQHSQGQPGKQESSDLIHPAGQAAAASAMVQTPAQNTGTYFAAVEDGENKERNVWERVKVKFQAAGGYLTKQFSGKNTFHAGQEQPKEDMRKRSRYHGEDEEIDCVLTDDTYLLDSYDRKGEFRQLTPKK